MVISGKYLIAAIAGVLVITSATAAAAAPGPQTTTVPWRQAGPGWSIVVYSAPTRPVKDQPAKSESILSLVSPQGRKFPFYVSPRTANAEEFWYEQISLVTGAVLTRFKVPQKIVPLGFTRPTGTSLLVTGFRNGLGLAQYSLTGHFQRALTKAASVGLLSSANGSFIVTGTWTGLAQISTGSSGASRSERARRPR